MNWPAFEARFPGATAATFRHWPHGTKPFAKGDKFGPVMWRVKYDGRTVEMQDSPGVLADIAKAFA